MCGALTKEKEKYDYRSWPPIQEYGSAIYFVCLSCKSLTSFDVLIF